MADHEGARREGIQGVPAVTRLRRTLLVTLLTVITLPAATDAHADRKNSKGSNAYAKGTAGGNKIAAETKVQVTATSSSGNTRKGNLSASEVNWTPPACWYEPSFSPKELESAVNTISGIPILSSIGRAFKTYYADGKPYKNYNLDKQGKGMFWVGVVNPNRKDDPEANSCNKPPFWVDAGKTPDEPLAVSPEILAEYAYDELPVPDTDISMNPDGRQTVNLDTWIWLDKATFKPVSVTASLPGTGLSATTTAKPVSLTLQPGTSEAELHPASGECAINEDGGIGAPYAEGKADQAPPCGITYLRSTTNSPPHKLKATLTWEISWTSTNGEGGDLPSGSYGTTTDITVGEVQSINR